MRVTESPELVARVARELLTRCDEGVLAFDRGLRITFCSARLAKILDMHVNEAEGRPVFDAFPFLLAAGERPKLAGAINGQASSTDCLEFTLPDSGKVGYLSIGYFPVEDGGGLALVRDISGRKLSEEILRETESRFQNMADHSPVMLWMAGIDSLCNFFNQSWLEFTGRTLEQEWGVGWSEGVHPEDFQRCMDTYIEAFNGRKAFEMTYRLRRADGEYRWILDRGAARYTPDGLFAGFIGSCVDITNQKRLETELRQAVVSRDEFLSIASHELKTPLSALSLQLGMLNHVAKEGVDVEAIRERVGRITTSTRKQLGRMTELIEDLLSVSRISAGYLALERTRVELGALVREVVERHSATAEASRCPVEITAPEPIYGNWDCAKLDQVVTNLLTNSLKYASGKPVTVSLLRGEGRAYLKVRDEGIGIEPDKLGRIFEKFQRGVSSRHYGGLGLGLYISRTIVERHGGRISVESAPGKGSTFTVELPLS